MREADAICTTRRVSISRGIEVLKPSNGKMLLLQVIPAEKNLQYASIDCVKTACGQSVCVIPTELDA